MLPCSLDRTSQSALITALVTGLRRSGAEKALLSRKECYRLGSFGPKRRKK